MPGVGTTTEVERAEVEAAGEVAADKASVVVVVEEAVAAANEAVVVVAAGTGVLMPMWDKAMEVEAWSISHMNMARL